MNKNKKCMMCHKEFTPNSGVQKYCKECLKINVTTYYTYRNMIYRCYKKTCKSYKSYGAKGIVVCQEWQGEEGYKNFLKDMGFKPSLCYHLHRKDNNLIYSKDTCIWIPKDIHYKISNLSRNRIFSNIRGSSETLDILQLNKIFN